VTLTKPDFRLDKPNPYAATTTDAMWWFWLRLEELHPDGQLGGTYADKPGFHNKGDRLPDHGRGVKATDYSIRDAVNRSGPGMTHASAIDWTFPDAQAGKYANIDKYSSRLLASMLDKNDPRLDLALFEFYGQADSDRVVEGYNEYREENVTSDSSHLWHIHMSWLRSKVGDYWSFWAALTVLMGWSVQAWRDSLPATDPNHKPVTVPPKKPTTGGLAPHTNGAHSMTIGHHGTDVLFVQKFIGSARAGAADGTYGEKTAAGVKWYQKMRGLGADGIVGPKTWKALGY
jgi:peptidoglycan hydrolase-like protein with peptidoglycan-binding domain